MESEMAKMSAREQIATLQKEGWTPVQVFKSKGLNLYNLRDPMTGESLDISHAWSRRQGRERRKAKKASA